MFNSIRNSIIEAHTTGVSEARMDYYNEDEDQVWVENMEA
jgi:hypothetical protein